MRSRYSAYALGNIEYIEKTTHPDKRAEFNREASEEWAGKSEWKGLEVLKTKAGEATDKSGQVEFIATYALAGQTFRHHELSEFRKEKGAWFFFDGQVFQKPFVKDAPKIGRNDPCACGSGAKFKKCCGAA